MHFLAIADDLRKPFKEDTLNELLESKNLNQYKKWLKEQSLLYYEDIQCQKGNKLINESCWYPSSLVLARSIRSC
ncbi:MAG: hypothetical protein Ct9H300mP3_09080 [Gammaproteobacteria bacterium]|nr:MAG: hypothetical protein Ct9H300mP3_09080 [Gammaproteobacteria bacterium]